MSQPDVKVGFEDKVHLKSGEVKAKFSLTNPTKQDAPVVTLIAECKYWKPRLEVFGTDH